MKKMSATAVFVVLMVSATNVFADVNCDQLASEIEKSKAAIAQGEKNIAQLNGYSAQIHTQMATDTRSEESFILGAGNPRLTADSLQIARLQGMTNEALRVEKEKLNKAEAEQAAAQCKFAEKAE